MNIKLSDDKFKVSTNEKIIVFIVGLSNITELLLYNSIYEFIEVINFKQAVVAFRSICYLTSTMYAGLVKLILLSVHVLFCLQVPT